MKVNILANKDEIAAAVSQQICQQVMAKPDSVLGLATGSTPIKSYAKIVATATEAEINFAKVKTFNLDEYWQVDKSDPISYHYFMHQHLFNHINLPAENIHFPESDSHSAELSCQQYEQQIADAGGIDLQLLGLGSNGHIGFNEPGSSLASRTRKVLLAASTIEDNKKLLSSPQDQPVSAISMGVGTILAAKKIILIATGPAKAAAVAKALEGPVSSSCPGSAIQLHPDVTIYLDHEAAQNLEHKAYYIRENETGL